MKVFCVGFHRTGTSSLAEALRLLGFKVHNKKRHPMQKLVELLKGNDLIPIFTIVKGYDVFRDNPWPLLFRELDKMFPKSKFILTLRDTGNWINSMVNCFGQKETEMRRWIYGIGAPKNNEERYKEVYRKHNADVIAYFKRRQNDLLVMNFEEGNGWKELCLFLNKQIPSKPFPHINKSNFFRGNL
jgi:hypothetical protein